MRAITLAGEFGEYRAKSMPVATLPKFKLLFSTVEIDKQLDALADGGAITALIFNDARSEDGTFYFQFVNNGRGPVRPINAKALHWVDPKTGDDVFAQYSKGVAPRHIVPRALAQVQFQTPELGNLAGKSIRQAVADAVNATAILAVKEMKLITPVVTGKLQSSYRIEPALEDKEHG